MVKSKAHPRSPRLFGGWSSFSTATPHRPWSFWTSWIRSTVFIMLLAATRSRVQHLGKGQQPTLSRQAQLKATWTNRDIEISVLFAEQALTCVSHSGRATLFSKRLWRPHRPLLMMSLPGHRCTSYTIFMCRFARGNLRRPLWTFSDILAFDSDSRHGWPNFRKFDEELCYCGPLAQKVCMLEATPALDRFGKWRDVQHLSFLLSTVLLFSIASILLGHPL